MRGAHRQLALACMRETHQQEFKSCPICLGKKNKQSGEAACNPNHVFYASFLLPSLAMQRMSPHLSHINRHSIRLHP